MVTALCVTTPARAGSPYDLNSEVTAVTMTSAAAFTLGAWLLQPEIEPSARGSQSRINPLDRWVVGNDSEVAADLSDVLLITIAAAPMIIDGFDVGLNGESFVDSFGPDALVYLQTQLVTVAITQLVKLGLRRPRPYTYRADFDASEAGVEDYVSFFSGHTSVAFAAAVSFSMTTGRRHPGSRGWAWGGSLALATTIGMLRVAAGKHFVTDVLAGAAIGGLIGWLVPHLSLPEDSHGSGVQTVSSPLISFSFSGSF